MEFPCPACGKPIAYEWYHCGIVGECPHCNASARVPEEKLPPPVIRTTIPAPSQQPTPTRANDAPVPETDDNQPPPPPMPPRMDWREDEEDDAQEPPQTVCVSLTQVDIAFTDLVVLFIKVGLAALPAIAIILFVCYLLAIGAAISRFPFLK